MKMKDATTVIARSMVGDSTKGGWAAKWMLQKLQDKKDEIQQAAEGISREMERLQADLAADGVDTVLNSLGAMHNKGNELDRLIGEFSTMQKLYREIATLV